MTKFYYKDKNAPKPNCPPSHGGIAFIKKNSKYLMEHRSDSDRWSFIGGRLEDDEDFEGCIKRELMEETGLISTKLLYAASFSDPSQIIQYENGDTRRMIAMAYDVEIEDFSQLRLSHESRDLKFLDPEEMKNIKIAETHIPIFNFLLKRESIE
jgi:8-oxo-dGTP pyrophosphatase MutT (NUDIX family)